MNKEELTTTRQLIRQEVFEILEEYVFPILVDAANAEESRAVSIKQQIKNMVEAQQPKPQTDGMADAEEIVFTRLMGTKGEYEKSEDFENPRFKALKTTLQAHNGTMTADGFFLWIFPDGKAIGRKRKA